MKGIFEDLTGKTYGYLRVIKRQENIKYENGDVKTVWLVECLKCGGIPFSVRGNNLKTGTSTQCVSCKNEEQSTKTFENLFGKTFGKLTVIGVNPKKKNGRLYWLVSCSCENESTFLVSAKRLKNWETKSCGCLNESFVAFETKKYFVKKYSATTEYPMLRSPKNGILKCDIYIKFSEEVYIEIHGKQHYQNNNYFFRSIEEYKYRLKLDSIKKSFAKERGKYIEVDLRKIKTPEESIKHIESKLKKYGFL